MMYSKIAYRQIRVALSLLIVSATNLFLTSANAQTLPNQVQTTKGELLSHNAPEMGRLAIIETLGDYVITIPEMPSSPAGSDYLVRAWDMSDPSSPVEVGNFGVTHHPFLAHGTIKRANELLVFGYPNNAIRLEEDGSLVSAPWSGPEGNWDRGGMMRPWAAPSYWTYGEVSGNAWLELDGVRTAEWDHLGLTGVTGFPIFMGNLLIYASDQANNGVATYDISDPANPVLLDVFNLPKEHPEFKDYYGNPLPYGIGGYWAEVSGHYIVFSRSDANSGIQIVDFSDPSNLKLHCEIFSNQPEIREQLSLSSTNNMYVGFQDNWVFSGEFKIDIETCELDILFDEEGTRSGGDGHYIDMGQYSRPIGNLLLSGGRGRQWNWPADANGAGMGVWVHETEPDTQPPYVAYHIPRANQTHYPVMAPLSFMIPETLRSETIVMGETVVIREVGGEAVAADYVLSHTGMLTVDPLQYLKDNTVYEVTLNGIEDAVHNAMQSYTFRFSTGSSLGEEEQVPPPNHAPTISSVTKPAEDILLGQYASFTVIAEDVDGDTLQYRYRVDGQEYSAWSSSAQFSVVFSEAGSTTMTVQAQDEMGLTATHVVPVSVTAYAQVVTPYRQNSQIAIDQQGNLAWVVNPDNHSVSMIDLYSQTMLDEIAVGKDPRAIAIDRSGNIWVTLKGEDAVVVLNGSGQEIARLDTGYGSAPFGLVIDKQRDLVYASLYGSGEAVRFDAVAMLEQGRIALAYSAHAIALSSDGEQLLVTRFISAENWGEVWQINASRWQLMNTFQLQKHLAADSQTNGHGVPNYLASVVISEDGRFAYVVGKKDNTDRSVLNNGPDLDDDNTVRTYAGVLDLTEGRELRELRFDFDNADSPSALEFSPHGDYLFVAMQGRNQVFVLRVNPQSGALAGPEAQFLSGTAPQAVVVNPEAKTLMVKNFTERSLSIMQIENFLNGGGLNPATATITTVSNEILTADVLAGKQMFYNAAYGLHDDEFSGRISAEGYISCASCHMDGGHDGRTYDFTGRGEGLRNNISMRGRGGVRFGAVHWSANFDEIQDFENDIRLQFRGRGLMTDDDFALTSDPQGFAKAGLSEELDQLAAYVAHLGRESLQRSPLRNSRGGLTDAALRGAATFEAQGCASCHRGKAFTDGDVHSVGTLRRYSGLRLGGEFEKISTPSLLGLFDTAPYLHDGSAQNLADVFISAGGSVFQAENLNHSGREIQQQGFSFVRDGKAVRLGGGQSISLAMNIAEAGKGSIAFRYGSTVGDASVTLHVGSAAYRVNLMAQPVVEGQDVNFIEKKVAVDFPAGQVDVSLTYNGTQSVVVDDLSVATPSDFNAAAVHTRVSLLAQSEQEALIAYLLQLDQQSAPMDDEEVVLGADNTLPVNQAPFARAEVVSNTANNFYFSAAATTDSDSSFETLQFTWHFGDGEVATGSEVSHQYLDVGLYEVSLKVVDAQGNASWDSTVVNVTSVAECQPDGEIQYQQYNGVYNNSVTALRAMESFPNAPNVETVETHSFAKSWSSNANYGVRMRGVFCAPESGEYVFFIAGDDNVELNLSTTVSASGLQRIAYHNGWTPENVWDKYATQTSASVQLEKGQRYLLEALMSDGGGSNGLAVGWQLPSGTLQRPIPASHFSLPQGADEGSENSPPTALVAIEQDSVSTMAFHFDASASHDAETATTDLQFAWDYGDGTTGSGMRVTHQYASAGSYDVNLVVTDEAGVSHRWQETVSVLDDGRCRAAGEVLYQQFNDVRNVTIAGLRAHPSFPQAPSVEQVYTDVVQTPVTSNGYFGVRLHGVLCAPESGEYIFYVAGDDNVELNLAPSEDPAGATRIAYHNSWSEIDQWTKYSSQTSAPVYLEAGKAYYLEALMSDNGVTNGLAVGWRKPSGELERPISTAYFSLPSGSVSQPNTAPVAEIAFQADDNNGLQVFFDGANSSDTETATEQLQFTWDFGDGQTAHGMDVTHSYSDFGSYQVRLTVTDANGASASTMDTVTLTAPVVACSSIGQVLYQRYNGIYNASVDVLKANANYPDNPSEETVFSDVVQTEVGSNGSFGVRVQGVLCVPESGEYVFYIAGDDNVELSLSSDTSEEYLTRIAYHTSWTNIDEWDKFATQQSAPVYLQKGQGYLLQALMSDQGGNNGLSVGWRMPDGTLERPMRASVFSLPE